MLAQLVKQPFSVILAGFGFVLIVAGLFRIDDITKVAISPYSQPIYFSVGLGVLLMACALLLTPERSFAESVVSEVISQIPALERESIASKAIKKYGAAIVTRNMEEAIDIANRFAPEHLELVPGQVCLYFPSLPCVGSIPDVELDPVIGKSEEQCGFYCPF